MHEYDCVLCGDHFTGWGNNPAPLAEDGDCCDNCNATKVIPARLAEHYAEEESE